MGTKIVQLRPRGTGSERDVANVTVCGHDAIDNGAKPGQGCTPRRRQRRRAIDDDGNAFTLSLGGTRISNAGANEGGAAIFFVSSDRRGSLVIRDSFLSKDPSAAFETAGLSRYSVLARGPPEVTSSTIEKDGVSGLPTHQRSVSAAPGRQAWKVATESTSLRAS